jgi:hypothetical protein
MNTKILMVILMIFVFNCLKAEENNIEISSVSVQAINELKQDIQNLKVENADLKNKVSNLKKDYKKGGVVLFLFGAFCALWAQNTKRNPWAWFFLGAIFSIITVFFLLKMNSEDIDNGRFSS